MWRVAFCFVLVSAYDFEQEYIELHEAVTNRMYHIAPRTIQDNMSNPYAYLKHWFCPQGFPGPAGNMGVPGEKQDLKKITWGPLLEHEVKCDIQAAVDIIIAKLERHVPQYDRSMIPGPPGDIGITGRSTTDVIMDTQRQCYYPTKLCMATQDVYNDLVRRLLRPEHCPSMLVGRMGRRGPPGLDGIPLDGSRLPDCNDLILANKDDL